MAAALRFLVLAVLCIASTLAVGVQDSEPQALQASLIGANISKTKKTNVTAIQGANETDPTADAPADPTTDPDVTIASPSPPSDVPVRCGVASELVDARGEVPVKLMVAGGRFDPDNCGKQAAGADDESLYSMFMGLASRLSPAYPKEEMEPQPIGFGF